MAPLMRATEVMRRLGVAAMLAQAACHDRPPEVFESEHFRFYAESDDPVCVDLDEKLEMHWAALSAYLGVELEQGTKIDVYKYRDYEALARSGPCPRQAGGCAVGREAFVESVTLDPFEHELVHTYAGLDGRAPLLFDEGLATMLQEFDGGSVGEPLPTFESVPLEDYMESDAWPESPSDAPYGAASSFVRSLVDRHGIEPFMAFWRSTPYGASREDIDASFESAFGETTEDALAAWRSGGAAIGWMPVAWCASPSLASEEPAPLDDFVCGVATKTMSLEAEGGVVVSTQDTDDTFVLVQPCAGGQPLWPAYWLLQPTFGSSGSRVELWADLPPGDYAVAAKTAVEPGTVTVERTTPVTARCEDAPVRPIASNTKRIDVVVKFEDFPQDETDPTLREAFVAFKVTEPRHFAMYAYPDDEEAGQVDAEGAEHRASASLCTECGECFPMTTAELAVRPGTYRLALTGTPADRRIFSVSFDPL